MAAASRRTKIYLAAEVISMIQARPLLVSDEVYYNIG